MSFRFNRVVITLNNYQQVFSDCTPDILDEIRSAILDDTNIAKFIEPCGTDSYKLGQIRMAIREFTPPEYLNVRFTGRTIYLIRQGIKKGLDMSEVLKYANKRGLLLNPDSIEKIAEFMVLGADVSKVDFILVPNNILDEVLRGLYKGYPMWLCISDNYTPNVETLSALMRGMQLGIDIHPFLSNSWTSDKLYLILSYEKKVDLNEFLSYINSNFSIDAIKVLLDFMSAKVPIQTLCKRDSDNNPIFNSYQMYSIGNAIADGTVTDEMYDVNLSDIEIDELHDKALKEKNKLLSVTLNKTRKKL